MTFNPKERITKGSQAKKIPMGNLDVYTRKITGFEYANYYSGPKFRNGDILLARITPCLENGKTAFVDILDDEEVGFGSTEFIVLRPSKNTDPNYAYYLARSPFFRKRAISCMEGTSGRKRVNEHTLKLQELPIPPLPTQVSIGKFLCTLDAKIDLNNRINAELEALARTIYDYWFLQFDFPDAAGRPYRSAGGRMQYDEIVKRTIPSQWQVSKVADVADTLSGGTPRSTDSRYYESGNIQWVNSGELNNPYIIESKNKITHLGLMESNAKLLPENTLLVALYGATAGKVSLLQTPACTNQAVCAIVPKSSNSVYFFKFYFESLYKYLVGLSSGSARDNLSQTGLRELQFIIPPPDLLAQFDRLIQPMIMKITLNLKENHELAALRDWLLPLLMSGEVRVGDKQEAPTSA